MLTLTENAAVIIKRLAVSVEDADTAGLRIGATGGSSTGFAVEIAAAPAAGDEVVEDRGAKVFLDPIASPGLAEKELDAKVDEASVHFTLRNRH